MPYRLEKNSDGKWCVFNKETNESKGCSETREMGVKHMRALYAAEEKEISAKELDTLVEKSIDEKCYAEVMETYIPWSITTFAGLDAWKAAEERREEIMEDTEAFKRLTAHILESYEIEDKESALVALAKEFGARLKTPPATKEIDLLPGEIAGDFTLEPGTTIKGIKEEHFLQRVLKQVGEFFGLKPKEPEAPPEALPAVTKESTLMLWKESDGRYHWIARYSNKFRDREKEILSSGAHARFVEKIDKGLAPLPELWFWHCPELMWGKATAVAYDDAGFTLATGYVLPGREVFAEAVAGLAPDALRVSHGMPLKSIVYDPSDPSVILDYETKEISPLPAWAAANELTGFYIMKEGDMPVPAEKRQVLVDMGIKPEILDALEAQNAKEASLAAAAGIDSKEVGESADIPAEVPAEETPAEAPAQETKEAPLNRQEVADAIANVLLPRLEAQDNAIKALTERIEAQDALLKELKTSDEAKLSGLVKSLAPASLTAILTRSVVGTPETLVDGRSALAKDKPKETPPVAPAREGDLVTGVISSILKEHTHTSQPSE